MLVYHVHHHPHLEDTGMRGTDTARTLERHTPTHEGSGANAKFWRKNVKFCLTGGVKRESLERGV